MNLSENEWNLISNLFGRATFYCSFIPLVIGFWKRQFFSKSIRIFYFYLLIDLSIAFLIQSFIWVTIKYTDAIMPILQKLEIGDTNFFGIMYQINVVGVLGWYFYRVIPNTGIANAIKWVSRVLIFAMLINYLFIEGFRGMGVFNPTVAAICGFVFPLIHLWYLFRQDYQLVLSRNPYFWIALGLVFSMLLGFFKTITGNQLFENDFILFAKFNIAKNILIGISFLLFSISFLCAHNTEFLEEDRA